MSWNFNTSPFGLPNTRPTLNAGAFNSVPNTTSFGQSTFGNNVTSSFPTPTFNTPNTTLFGSTGHGFQSGSTANTSGIGTFGVFGPAQTAQQSFQFGARTDGNSVFGFNNPNTGRSFGFGVGTNLSNSSGLGTPFSFRPTIGTDTMVKNGIVYNVNTRLQCLTAMREYDSKSFEELRTEDYIANRKGTKTQLFGGFSAPMSGIASSFAPTPVKPAFSTPNTSLFGSNSQTSSRWQFGNTAQTPGGLFGSSSVSPMEGITISTTSSEFSCTAQTNTGFFGESHKFGFSSMPWSTSLVLNNGVPQQNTFGTATPQTNTFFGAATSQPSGQTPGFGLFSAPTNQNSGFFSQNGTPFGTSLTSFGHGKKP